MTAAAVAALAVLAIGGVALIVFYTRPRTGPVRAPRPSSGWDYIALGAVISGGAGVLLGLDAPAWAWGPAGWFGSLLVLIGAIGVGVTVGTRRANS